VKTIIQIILVILGFTCANAQSIRNALTETVSVNGNCEKCKKQIETAAGKKGIVKALWDAENKLLRLTYDSTRTSRAEILRRVAYAGFDNAEYLAPATAYEKLPECCRYKRDLPLPVKKDQHTEHIKKEKVSAASGDGHKNGQHSEDHGKVPEKHDEHKDHTGQNNAEPSKLNGKQQSSEIHAIYEKYFMIKDALVNDNAGEASSHAKEFTASLELMDMRAMKPAEHKVFMQYLPELKSSAASIGGNKALEKQRKYFVNLSTALHEVMKVIKPPYEVFIDHCPMYLNGKGADWLSREKNIKNPYYGSSMLKCGNVSGTIK
jgi:hypothetical protein